MYQKGLIFDIKRYAIHDGPGVRTTIFFKGCPMRCWWCHNPEGLLSEIETIEQKQLNNTQTPFKETIGRMVSTFDVMQEIEKDYLFYDESKGGVTFSGGEPLSQIDFLSALLKECNEKNYHTTIETSGYAPKESLRKIAKKTDLFLYDLKIMNEQKHIHYTGVSNKIILTNLEYLVQEKKSIIIRIPIIPNITDTEENVQQLGKYLSIFENISKVELLPYHKLGNEKYKKLNIENKMKNIGPPTEDKMNELKILLKNFGLPIQ